MAKLTFVHTSDLHLEAKKSSRLEVLRWILEKARELKSALIISGDLYNSGYDAGNLFSAVQDMFSSFQDVTIFILPGNRDEDSFINGADYGDNVKLFNEIPFKEVDFNGIKLVGVPYQTNLSISKAVDGLKTSGLSIFLVHGTFFHDDTGFVRQEMKRRDAGYFPFYLDDIVDKNIVYVASGHFHSNFAVFNNGNTNVCYPGTPVSMSETETDIRKIAVVVIDTESGELQLSECPVEVGIYKLRKEFCVYPGSEADTMKAVVKYLTDNRNNRVDVKVKLNGFIKTNTTRLNDVIEKIDTKFRDDFSRLVITNSTLSYQSLIDNHLLAKEFINRLENYDIDNTIKNRAVELGLKALDSVL